MKQLTLYDKYRKNVLASGGFMDFMGDDKKTDAVSSLALMGGQAMGDGPSLGKGALSGLGTGMSVGKNFGPMGAAIGAGAGLLIGGIGGALGAAKERREAELADITMKTRLQSMDMNRSRSRLASDPTLATGNANASYFEEGGSMGDSTRLYNRKANLSGYKPAFSELERYQGKENTPEYKSNKSLFSYMNKASNNGRLKYNGVVGPDDIHNSNPTPTQSIFTAGAYYQRNTTDLNVLPSNIRNPDTAPQTTLSERLRAKMNTTDEPVSYAANGGFINKKGRYVHEDGKTTSKPGLWSNVHMKNKRMENGGDLKAPLSTLLMNGGTAKSLSTDNTELIGNSHAEGGIDIPQIGAEVEEKETTAGDYVFSKKLGFAALHKPIAKAKGKIESKPPTRERVNSLKLLMGKENALKDQQEMVKQQLNLS